MNFKLLLSLILIINGFKSSIAEEDWSYKNPDEWKTQFPKDCGGERQSPINIEMRSTIPGKPIGLKWNNYKKLAKSASVSNNGHTLQLNQHYNDGEVPSITSDLFNGEYYYFQSNFHWGEDDTTGSDHTIDGKSFPLELHLIHLKKGYDSLDEAVKHEDGGVVIVGFYEIGETESHVINKFLEKLDDFKKVGSDVEVIPCPLSHFEVVESKNAWVSYNGSATYPNCWEVVTWIIPTKPHQVTQSQMKKWREIEFANGDSHNNRPVQPLNGRKVCMHPKEYNLLERLFHLIF